jgi:hypothetical protein
VYRPRAVSLIARAASGLTRRINILADKSLLSAFTENSHAVTDRQVRAAIADSEFAAVRTPRRPAAFVAAALAGGLLGGAAIQWFLSSPPAPPPAPVSAAAPAPIAAAAPGPEPVPAPAPPQTQAAQSPEPPPRQLSAEQQRRLAGYSAAGQQLLRSRISATRELLDRAPGERYSVELFVTDNTDPARMERFLLRARELVPLENLFVIPVASAGSYRLRVIYGEFDTREEALEAERRLPPRYQQAFRVALRSIAELRGQI